MNVEQAMYFFLEGALASPVCKGSVLNVGLGPGLSARLLLLSRRVTRVVTVENNPATIAAYREKYPDTEALERRHTIVEWDAATVPGTALQPPFDWVYVDTIHDATQEEMNTLESILGNVKGLLAVGGSITFEGVGDRGPGRHLLNRMEDAGWTSMIVRGKLAETGVGRAGAMVVWTPPTGGN